MHNSTNTPNEDELQTTQDSTNNPSSSPSSQPSKRTLQHHTLTLAILEGREAPGPPTTGKPVPTFDKFLNNMSRRKAAIRRLFPEVLLQPDGRPPLHIDRRRRETTRSEAAAAAAARNKGGSRKEGELADEHRSPPPPRRPSHGLGAAAVRGERPEGVRAGETSIVRGEPGASSSLSSRASTLRPARRLPRRPYSHEDIRDTSDGVGKNEQFPGQNVSGRAESHSGSLPPPPGPPPMRPLPHTPMGALAIGFWEGEDGDEVRKRPLPKGTPGRARSSSANTTRPRTQK